MGQQDLTPAELWKSGCADLEFRLPRSSKIVQDGRTGAVGLSGMTMYQTRHSAATIDRVLGFRTLQEVQKRGQQSPHTSVTRYDKSSRPAADCHSPAPTARQARYTRATCLRECGLSDEDALFIFLSRRWRHAETSRCLVCCTDRNSETPRGTSETCFCLLRRRFFQKHNKQLCSHRAPAMYKCWPALPSDLWMFKKLLPQHVVEQKSVAAMQHELQMLLKFRAANGGGSWLHTFSPRVPLSQRPLHLLFLRLRHASFLAVALPACGYLVEKWVVRLSFIPIPAPQEFREQARFWSMPIHGHQVPLAAAGQF